MIKKYALNFVMKSDLHIFSVCFMPKRHASSSQSESSEISSHQNSSFLQNFGTIASIAIVGLGVMMLAKPTNV